MADKTPRQPRIRGLQEAVLKDKSVRHVDQLRDGHFKRSMPGGVEFLMVTREAAVVPEKVREMMLEFDARVRHYEIFDN